MVTQRLNHAVLYVRDAAKSAEFYCRVLGFKEVANLDDRAIFLQASGSTNDHDLGLFSLGGNGANSAAGQTAVGLYHLAWEVDTLSELQRLVNCRVNREPLLAHQIMEPQKLCMPAIPTDLSSR